jgi:hypothetical protein
MAVPAIPVIAGLSRVAIKKLMKSPSGKKMLASLKKKLASGTKTAKKNLKKVVKDVNKKVSPKKTAADRKDAKLTGKDARNRDLNLLSQGAVRSYPIAAAGTQTGVLKKDVDEKNKKPNPKAKGLNVGSKQNISSAKKKSKGVASSFDEAFKANRAVKGAGQTFTYKGKSYTTDTKAEIEKKKKDTLTKNMAKAATRSGAKLKNMYGGGKVKKMMGGGYMKKMSYGGKVKKMMGGGKVKKRYV